MCSIDNTFLGKFRLDGIANAPARVPDLVAEFDIDANGTLTVTARDNQTKSTNYIRISAFGNGELSTNEIKCLIEEAERMEIEDKKEELRIIARKELEFFCFKMQLDKSEFSDLEKIRYLVTKG